MSNAAERPSLAPFALPRWGALPELDLYMDQLIGLLEKYLAPMIEENHDKVISRAIINNYVKLKILPPPQRKRYTREHIAYLIILCTLKSVLPLPVISRMIAARLESQSMEVFYDRFCQMVETGQAQIAFLAGQEGSDGLDLPFEMALLSALGAQLAQRAAFAEQG